MYPFKMKLNPLLLTVIATSMILFDWSPKQHWHSVAVKSWTVSVSGKPETVPLPKWK